MIQIPLPEGKFAIIDEADASLVLQYEWGLMKSAHGGFYAQSKTRNTTAPRVLMHRLIAHAPKGYDVDHKDNNGLNNTRDNLRVCSRSQNQANCDGRPKLRKSKYKGVYFEKRREHWVAYIKQNQKAYYLGSFPTEELAGLAYNRAALMRFGDFAKLNGVAA